MLPSNFVMKNAYGSIVETINLKDKVAIVTGGAMGIGYGIVYRLAEAGASVLIADMNEEVGQSAAQQIANAGYIASFVHTDVSNADDVQRAVSTAHEKYGGLDIMVNNAGIYPISPLMDMPLETFEKILSVNLKSVFLFTKAAAEVMKKSKHGGKIINVSSIDALHPSSVGLAAYDASKHGVWGFTKNSSLELAAYNIQVNAIAPGGISTPGAGAGNPAVEKIQKAFIQKIPMKRMGDPDDIGKVALFLASDLASYITGTQIVVDGGVLLA